MELTFPKYQIKPIIPKQKYIDNKSSYNAFLKKGYRVIQGIEIAKREETIFSIRKSEPFRLVKVFKTLKYVRKLDLSDMTLIPTSLYLPKVMYFAKRMSNASIILINDIKPRPANYRGTTEIWPKYAKRATVFQYDFNFKERLFRGMDGNPNNQIKKSSKFLHMLKFQSSVKCLTIRFTSATEDVHENYWKFQKYPSSLQKLSLIEPEAPVCLPAPSSFSHLKNLKSLEISRTYRSNRDFQGFIFQLLPQVFSQLQSLSLTLPPPPSPSRGNLSLLEQNSHLLKQLTKLKLSLHCTKTNNFENILEAFSGCPLDHLTLKPHIEAQGQLRPLGNFIKQFQNLQSLKLQVRSQNPFRNAENTKEILKQIDDLALLRKLSVSIFSTTDNTNSFSELNPFFPKMLTKPIPLQSFQLHLSSFKISNQDFLNLLQSLEPLAPALIKLTIDIGEYKVIKKESQTVLNFIRSLKNIRVLKLQSLSISLRDFLMEFTDVIYEKPYLRNLAIGEVKETISKPLIFDEMERILTKGGLVKFYALVSDRFRPSLSKDERSCPNIKLADIKKINPCLRRHPPIPIFNYEGLYSNW